MLNKPIPKSVKDLYRLWNDIMLNKPLPKSVKDLYRLWNEMAAELLNASGNIHKL